MSAAKVCDYCGQPCKGYASISMGGETRWYHHGDDNGQDYDFTKNEPIPPSCYERAQWAMSGVRPDQRWIDELTMHEVYSNPDGEGV